MWKLLLINFNTGFHFLDFILLEKDIEILLDPIDLKMFCLVFPIEHTVD